MRSMPAKPFAQLQRAGMKTAVMDQIMRQRDPELKAAVEASLAGAAATRWLALPAEDREGTGLMAPSHVLREGINGIIRERLARDGVVHGPAIEIERLISRGFTSAEKALARNYQAGDLVGFHRPYKRLGVEKGDEFRVAGVDQGAGTVEPERVQGREAAMDGGRSPGRESDASESRERDRAPGPEMEHGRVPKGIERDMALSERYSGAGAATCMRPTRTRRSPTFSDAYARLGKGAADVDADPVAIHRGQVLTNPSSMSRRRASALRSPGSPHPPPPPERT